MKKNWLPFFLIAFTLFSCKQEKKEIFIIFQYQRKIDSVGNVEFPNGQKWYSRLVVMFSDSTVYLYQTEFTDNRCIVSDETKNPSFIDLEPNHFLQFKGPDFISFMNSNSKLLGFDEPKNKSVIFLHLVSLYDSIQNPSFFEFEKWLKSKRSKKLDIFWYCRIYTEEERIVLEYLKKNQPYDCMNINWSNNFLDGKSKPHNNHYDSLESKIFPLIKAVSSIGSIRRRIWYNL